MNDNDKQTALESAIDLLFMIEDCSEDFRQLIGNAILNNDDSALNDAISDIELGM